MKTSKLFISILALSLSFAGGYLTCSLRHPSALGAPKKNNDEIREAEKKFDDFLKIPGSTKKP